MWSALNNQARHLRDVRSSRSASATVSECRHGAIQPGHDVGGRQSGALFSWAATISGAGLGGGAAISTGGIPALRELTAALAQLLLSGSAGVPMMQQWRRTAALAQRLTLTHSGCPRMRTMHFVRAEQSKA